jgi:hypothetical protein
VSNGVVSTAQLPYTAQNGFWMFLSSSFSTTNNSITARCFNVRQAQSYFHRLLQQCYLSDDCVLIHMGAINFSVSTSQFSHCYLYYGMSKIMWNITFWATFVLMCLQYNGRWILVSWITPDVTMEQLALVCIQEVQILTSELSPCNLTKVFLFCLIPSTQTWE